MFTSRALMARTGGYPLSARGLLGRADGLLRRELKTVRTSEVALSSFSFGVLQGKFKAQGGLTLFGLPVDLLCGTAFHVVGLLGFARPYAHHLHAFGDGALASFFCTTGYRVGERWASSGSIIKGLSGMLGDAPVTGGATLADRTLSSLVRGDDE